MIWGLYFVKGFLIFRVDIVDISKNLKEVLRSFFLFVSRERGRF